MLNHISNHDIFSQVEGDDCIVIDDWIIFRASPRIAHLVKVNFSYTYYTIIKLLLLLLSFDQSFQQKNI